MHEGLSIPVLVEGAGRKNVNPEVLPDHAFHSAFGHGVKIFLGELLGHLDVEEVHLSVDIPVADVGQGCGGKP